MRPLLIFLLLLAAVENDSAAGQAQEQDNVGEILQDVGSPAPQQIGFEVSNGVARQLGASANAAAQAQSAEDQVETGTEANEEAEDPEPVVEGDEEKTEVIKEEHMQLRQPRQQCERNDNEEFKCKLCLHQRNCTNSQSDFEVKAGCKTTMKPEYGDCVGMCFCKLDHVRDNNLNCIPEANCTGVPIQSHESDEAFVDTRK